MANFAKLGFNNKVLEVITINDSECYDADNNESEAVGAEYLENLTGWPRELWKKTSRNTIRGIHFTVGEDGYSTQSADQTKAYRKNYASVGGIYDEDRDAFIPPKPHASWILNETTCVYEAPVTRPTAEQARYTIDGVEYNYQVHWDEDNQKYYGSRLQENPITNYDWNPNTLTWTAQ